MAKAEREAVVIGAGVIGLTTAIRLADAGFSVRVHAAAPPEETTSRIAGAMWGSTFAGPADKVTAWAEESLAVFRELAADPGSGVVIGSGVLASSTGEAPPPQLFPGVEVRPCDPPEGFAAAFRVALPVIDMPRHLHHLVNRLRTAGVELELRELESLSEAADEAPVVVNCAGMGARKLVPDPDLRPVRGQHVVVENPGLDEFFTTEPFGPAWTSWFPHRDRVVLGSVAQEDDWEMEPRESDANLILERCAALEPRLRDARVIGHQVGLRPAREVVRVEAEALGAAHCIHNYGHGGTGVGLSWGCAREVVSLLEG
ncbi:MAG: FAD-dependent oxidoreductase [Solirubrobacterales bacterium]